jgi:hypothetical protein
MGIPHKKQAFLTVTFVIWIRMDGPEGRSTNCKTEAMDWRILKEAFAISGGDFFLIPRLPRFLTSKPDLNPGLIIVSDAE